MIANARHRCWETNSSSYHQLTIGPRPEDGHISYPEEVNLRHLMTTAASADMSGSQNVVLTDPEDRLAALITLIMNNDDGAESVIWFARLLSYLDERDILYTFDETLTSTAYNTGRFPCIHAFGSWYRAVSDIVRSDDLLDRFLFGDGSRYDILVDSGGPPEAPDGYVTYN